MNLLRRPLPGRKRPRFTGICKVIIGLITAGSCLSPANPLPPPASSWIRINQLGYLPASVKVAVFLSEETNHVNRFRVEEEKTGKTVFKGIVREEDGSVWGMRTALRLDFSALKTPGLYRLRLGKTLSPPFPVNRQVYKGSASVLLTYLRQQRCGFNPCFKDSCHLFDGFIADHLLREGEIIDVTGGWHDASDYLQYTATSAHAVYQLLLAWSQHPGVYGDEFLANGLSGLNGIPDILDEAIWGLEWLLKMNPAFGEMYNQIADDRDHRGFRLPAYDTVSYGNGRYRPVYHVTGKPQGLSEWKNRTTGVSSVAGKFAAAFALGSRILASTSDSLATLLRLKAEEAYRYGLTDPGATQTACFSSPYFYEEDNWVDDMELAAAELFKLTGEKRYFKEACLWGQAETVSPWMVLNYARHYQFYPFLNLGHRHLASSEEPSIRQQFSGYWKEGLEAIRKRAEKDPFRVGIPFIWCSNNLVSAAVTQARMYMEITGDPTYEEMEAALRDWLLGCNPWGTSMICGLPATGDSPVRPHSSLTFLTGRNTTGGLVDGPVYPSIFQNQIGNILLEEDVYPRFQGGIAVYHDDIGDYTSNEPTMDGTASLSWYFSWLESQGLMVDPAAPGLQKPR